MTPEYYHAVQTSYARIEPELDEIALVFFQKLMRQAPEWRSALPQGPMKQKVIFTDLLGYAVRNLHRKQALEAKATQIIGRYQLNSRMIGVLPTVGVSLAYAIKERAREGLSPLEMLAWMEAFARVSDVTIKEMLDAAA